MRGTGGKPVVIGFDTSNYRTSAAAVTLDGEILVNHRELLPVPDGERGLRQSDAVFAHIRQLRTCEDTFRAALKDTRIVAAADAEVRGHYSWDIITDRLLEFYREVSRIHRRR